MMVCKERGKMLFMSTEQFNLFFEKMMDGFAYHKIIVDEASKPVNYVFLEVNKAFEEMTGLKKEKIIGKKVTEVLKGVEKDPSDWIGVYGCVALTGTPVQFENFAESIGKWFKVSAYCPEEGYFVTLFEDVTERKKVEEELRRVNEDLEERVRKRTEEVTRERQRLYNVLETLPAYVVLLDKDYRVPFANKFFRERFGESLGRRCYEYLFNRTSVCENCESYKVLKKNGPHHWEWIGPDGHNYDIYDFPFVEADGSNLILEMGIDVTERKRAEEQIRAASLYVRSLIEASIDPLVTINAEGKITDVNKATETVTGYSRKHLIGSDFSEYFTEPEKARVGYQRVFTHGYVKDYPLVVRHKTGKLSDVLYNATVFRNEAGEIQGVFAAARDITDLKKAEEKYQKLFNSIDEGFCIIEMVFDVGIPVDFRFLEINSSFERQTGLHDAQGKLIRSLTPHLESFWFEIYGKVALTGMPVRFTNEAKALNRWYDVYAFPVGEGEIRKVAILFNDITERRKLEKQLQNSERLAAIGATAGMVGHDIRNPLQAIVGDLYLAKAELASIPDSEEKRNIQESLESIGKNSEYISKILADLQDYARPLNPLSEKTDLTVIINDLTAKNGLPAKIKAYSSVENEAARITADPAFIRRILGNLVSNAVQAMPRGGKLSISAYKESDDIVIRVKDTGVGIPDHVKPELFTPLFTTKSRGQGFGLAVCKRLVEALNGTITFWSEEGKGTEFIVRLPSRKNKQ
jgi:PAS domain S-box-containing protein